MKCSSLQRSPPDPDLSTRVGTQPLRHRRDNLKGKRVISFDGIAELRVAEHHGLDGTVRNHRRGRRSAVQHADLAEEVTGAQPGGRLAGAGDLHVTTLDDEEGLGRLSLADQRLTGLETDLIDATGNEPEVALRQPGEEGHMGQSIDLRIRHDGNTTPT